MSTTAKVLEKMNMLLANNESGLTSEELWAELMSDKELSKELVDKNGNRRNGVVVGLTTRIKTGKVENIKVIKNNDNKLVYISCKNNIEFVNKLTNKFIEDIKKLEMGDLKELSAEDKKIVKEFEKGIKNLNNANDNLEKLSQKIQEKQVKKK
ncbi:hypothetical protein JZO73_08095 [Enterococcus plantarum]|uniref:hypothetical protein n=1 Tax=Enterococcus plantarum TaxID=1077675 RepID=UPI001A8E4F05|nr:hypothetical protein [Enterococcus plantarum]MBO0467497.1 hypothetical protein [Enterococcus plantarum]